MIEDVKDNNIYFKYKIDNSEHYVYLGNFEASLPGSYSLKNFKIKSVLSIIEFPNSNAKLKPLEDIFKDNENTIYNNIMYQNLGIPDVENPSLIEYKSEKTNELNEFEKEYYGAIEILTKSSIYINERLKYGSVLVHCEKGRRRSPTIIIAWLVSNGFKTNQAIKEISNKYFDNNNPSYDWGSKYRLTREKWIYVIESWLNNIDSYRLKWMKDNLNILKKWNEKFDESDLVQLEEASKKRKRENINADDDSGSKKKVFKRVKKNATKPITWKHKKV